MTVRSTLRTLAAGAVALGVGISVSGFSAGAVTAPTLSSAHALFVETDGDASNHILSYVRGSDGSVSYFGSYATGGTGLTAADAVADPLASQGGLQLVNHDTELLATNAGSNTVTVFSVNGASLTPVQQIGSGGLFPDSIAVHNNFVAVLNAGGEGSVAEFKLVKGLLAPVAGSIRALALGGTNPPNFLHGAGQVGYSPSGAFLVVTTKLSSNDYDVFRVSATGSLSATPTVTTANNDVPYAFVFTTSGLLVATEASNSSVSVYSIGTTGALTSLGQVSDGEAALCWISASKGYFYGDNAGSGTVSEFSLSSAKAPQLVNATAGTAHGGTTDSTTSPDGNYLYVMSGGAGTIDVFSVALSGALTPVESLLDLPVAAEGIAAS